MKSFHKIPFKVTDVTRSRKVGVVISCLAELKKKANQLFGIGNEDNLKVFHEDGTEVCDDGYLMSLKKHSLLIVSPKKPPLRYENFTSALQNYLDALHNLQQHPHQEVYRHLNDNNDVVNSSFLVKWVATLSQSKSHLSLKSDHPEWFEGCNKLVKTKEDYFRKCAQGRIRSYLRDAQSKLLDENSSKLIETFKSLLSSQKYFGCYFDRADICADRICDEAGNFVCEGRYNRSNCTDFHQINPYDNAESRIIFSTWNLDHVFERVNILSSLQKLTKDNNLIDSCLPKYYDLLFTRKNLKLVHKSCHVIAPHTEIKID